MNRPKPGSTIDISQLVEKLDLARDSIAYDADKHHYDRHHYERSEIDTVFDDLIDWLRAHQPSTELTQLVKPASDPGLQPGDVIVVSGQPATVREIRFHAPRSHADSGLPQHQAATEIVTGSGSVWFSLAPQV
jgi:superfamily I DNA and RNA helicase